MVFLCQFELLFKVVVSLSNFCEVFVSFYYYPYCRLKSRSYDLLFLYHRNFKYSFPISIETYEIVHFIIRSLFLLYYCKSIFFSIYLIKNGHDDLYDLFREGRIPLLIHYLEIGIFLYVSLSLLFLHLFISD